MNAPKLELRPKAGLAQSMVMTQALQQSIRLLQANAIELKEYVENALEENPFLSQDEGNVGDSTTDNDGQGGDSFDSQPAIDQTSNEPENDETYGNEAPASHQESSADYTDEYSTDYSNDESYETDYLRHSQSSTGSGYNHDEDNRSVEDNPANSISLREHLLNQLQLEVEDPMRRMIGAHLIDLVDEAGYIKDDFSPIGEMLGVEPTEIEQVLTILQGFDPTGVCARTLQGCLALQLREKNRLDPAMEALLANLPLLAGGKYAELQKKCGVDKEDLRQMVSEIRSLNPKPASSFTREIVQTVEPDILIHRLPDGNWQVELNMGNFPKIMVNRRFYKKVTSETRNKKDKEYLTEKLEHANWLVRALEQRADTMLKVASELVKQQDSFFRLGVRYLKPMTLKDVAAATGYHESTISRVVNGKYLECPRGTFELKYFFTSALTSAISGSSDVSSQSVKSLIKELIDKETIDNILQDDAIVDLLKERGISVARRTIAKYREAIGIPSSAKRKRIKQSNVI